VEGLREMTPAHSRPVDELELAWLFWQRVDKHRDYWIFDSAPQSSAARDSPHLPGFEWSLVCAPAVVGWPVQSGISHCVITVCA
jgi:hypothetical protein